jgi:hypothetical protein
LTTVGFFLVLMVASLLLFPRLGQDFFPRVDAGQMRLHVRTPTGTRIEEAAAIFASIEREIRQVIPSQELDSILDNIGLPNRPNIALTIATVGPMDGEILISLTPKHRPTALLMATLRRELPERFPGFVFFFQPADIVSQVLNFGQPAPIDIRVSGPDSDEAYALATKLAQDLQRVPGIVDSHVFQVPDAPTLAVDVDRDPGGGARPRSVAHGQQRAGHHQRQRADGAQLLGRSAERRQLSPGRLSCRPTGSTRPTTFDAAGLGRGPDGRGQLLMNLAELGRGETPLVMSQLNIRPVFDVQPPMSRARSGIGCRRHRQGDRRQSPGLRRPLRCN